MSWFIRSQKNIKDKEQKDMPDGLWTKCPKCSEVIFKKQLEENIFTCPKCNHHFRIGSKEYINIILDEDSFKETHQNIRSADPLDFEDSKKYTDRLEAAYKKTGLNDAITTGFGKIHGQEVSFACMNFSFVGGSMGSVVGEKFLRAARDAISSKIPLIVISSSGGARMQEAALSLMQLAKTSSILTELSETGLPYISVLTDPTTGGVTASYSMLGDVNIAEPGALIGFAGPRVIENTIRKKLPQGFQRSEFLQDHGFVDMIVKRQDLKDKLKIILDWFMENN